jgi:hypothetical protein
MTNPADMVCYGIPGQRAAAKISNPKPGEAVRTGGIANCRVMGFVIKDKDSEIKHIAMIHSLSEHEIMWHEPAEFIQQYHQTCQKNSLFLESTLVKRGKKDSFATFLSYVLKEVDPTQDTIDFYFVQSVPFYEDDHEDRHGESSKIYHTLQQLGYRLNPLHRIETTQFFAINDRGQTFCSEAILRRNCRMSVLLAQLQAESEQEIQLPFFKITSAKTIKIEFLSILSTDTSEKPNLNQIYKKLAIQYKKTPIQIQAIVLSGTRTHRVKDLLITEGLIPHSPAIPKSNSPTK